MRSSWRAAALIVVAALSVSGCVTYALPGISQQPGAADPHLQMLARQALRHWDAHAQLELGIRYEYGQGVPQNWKLAAQLYANAADSTPGGMFLGMTNGHPDAISAYRKGLPEAKVRLRALQAKMKAAGMPCVHTGWMGLLC